MTVVKQKLWGITDTFLVYTDEAKADYMSEWHKKKISSLNTAYIKQKYNKYEIFPDCFVDKLKAGYTTMEVLMLRDGSVISIRNKNIIPTRWGFNFGKITTGWHEGKEYIKEKLIVFQCLAKDEEEAKALCENYRLKTFLDDIWFKKENAMESAF